MIDQIKEIMLEAGKIVRNADHANQLETNKTGRRDFVTYYDRKVQEVLFTAFAEAIPGVDLIGEEADRKHIPVHGPFCIIDPIDGTANFVKDVKRSCISVAYGEDGTVTQGFVYDPYLDEMFSAELGEGAFLNGVPLIRNNDIDLSNSLVCFGTNPYNESLAAATFAAAELVFHRSLDVRRTGTAALDLCYSAANRFDLFFEAELSPWDHAAGELIVKEAGGVVTDFDGSVPSLTEKSTIVSGSRLAVEEFMELLRNGAIFRDM